MVEKGFVDDAMRTRIQHEIDQWGGARIKDLQLPTPVTAPPGMPCSEAVATLRQHGFDHLPVVGDDGRVLGLLSMGQLLSRIASGRVQSSDPVSRAMIRFTTKRKYVPITPETPLAELRRFFERNSIAIVTETAESRTIKSVLTKVDLLAFLLSKPSARTA